MTYLEIWQWFCVVIITIVVLPCAVMMVCALLEALGLKQRPPMSMDTFPKSHQMRAFHEAIRDAYDR